MARLISNLPMPIGADRVRPNLPPITYTGGYAVDGFDYQSGTIEYSKEADMKSFTIKPFANNMINVKQLMQYSTCSLTSNTEGYVFEKYGYGFRYNFNYLGSENVTGTQLDIDLTNTGSRFEAGKTYTLSFAVGNSTNIGTAYLPDGNWAYGGNVNEEGTTVYHSIAPATPNAISSYQGSTYVTFTAEETCYHVVYNPNTNFTRQNSIYTLWICGLVEGDKPSFYLPNGVGQHPIVSTCNTFYPQVQGNGNYAIKETGGYHNLQLGNDAVHMIQALDNAIYANKNIFDLTWR